MTDSSVNGSQFLWEGCKFERTATKRSQAAGCRMEVNPWYKPWSFYLHKSVNLIVATSMGMKIATRTERPLEAGFISESIHRFWASQKLFRNIWVTWWMDMVWTQNISQIKKSHPSGVDGEQKDGKYENL